MERQIAQTKKRIAELMAELEQEQNKLGRLEARSREYESAIATLQRMMAEGLIGWVDIQDSLNTQVSSEEIFDACTGGGVVDAQQATGVVIKLEQRPSTDGTEDHPDDITIAIEPDSKQDVDIYVVENDVITEFNQSTSDINSDCSDEESEVIPDSEAERFIRLFKIDAESSSPIFNNKVFARKYFEAFICQESSEEEFQDFQAQAKEIGYWQAFSKWLDKKEQESNKSTTSSVVASPYALDMYEKLKPGMKIRPLPYSDDPNHDCVRKTSRVGVVEKLIELEGKLYAIAEAFSKSGKSRGVARYNLEAVEIVAEAGSQKKIDEVAEVEEPIEEPNWVMVNSTLKYFVDSRDSTETVFLDCATKKLAKDWAETLRLWGASTEIAQISSLDFWTVISKNLSQSQIETLDRHHKDLRDCVPTPQATRLTEKKSEDSAQSGQSTTIGGGASEPDSTEKSENSEEIPLNIGAMDEKSFVQLEDELSGYNVEPGKEESVKQLDDTALKEGVLAYFLNLDDLKDSCWIQDIVEALNIPFDSVKATLLKLETDEIISEVNQNEWRLRDDWRRCHLEESSENDDQTDRFKIGDRVVITSDSSSTQEVTVQLVNANIGVVVSSNGDELQYCPNEEVQSFIPF